MNLPRSKKEFLPNVKSANVGRNLLWMVWSGVVSIANSVLVWMFIARMRDVEELGRFTVVMGLYALFFSVCSLGLMPFLISEISRISERNKNSLKNEQVATVQGFIGSTAIFLLISGTACAILMAVCGLWASESFSARFSTLILSFAMIPTGVICLAEATAISYNRTRLIAFVTTLENVLRTIVPLALIWFGFSISAVCISFVAVRFMALSVYLLAARTNLSNFSFNAAVFRKIAKVSPTFAGTIIFASINLQAVIILLGHFSTEIESAKYGVASRFLIPVSILMASYAAVIQPLLAKDAEEKGALSGSYLSKMARYPLILATLAAIVSPFLSPYILTLFFGDKYAAAAPTLNVLALSVVPFCLVMVVARGLVATNSQHVDFIANALGSVACFSAGLLLIPRYGAPGAAAAQLISFLLMALVEIVYLSRKASGFKIWRTTSVSSAYLLIIYIILWKR